MSEISLLPDNFDLKSFLQKYEGFSGITFTARLKKDFGKYSAFLAEQIKLHKKAELKLPTYTNNSCLFTTKSFEQSSSELTAEFKAKLFSGNRLLDLTGGLGVDDWAFSKSFKQITSIDNDAKLNEISRYNFLQLGINKIERIDADAYEYINLNKLLPKQWFGKQSKSFDLLYIDSDRRTKPGGSKSVTLHDTEPSILKLKDKLFNLSRYILLKLSPLIDLSYLSKTLHETENIYVVSLNNEVKEILALLNKTFSGVPEMVAIDLSESGEKNKFSGMLNEQNEAKYDSDGKYFYEPANALIKSDLTGKYAAKNKLKQIAKNSLYLTGDVSVAEFFGRRFKVISKIPFGKSEIKKYLEGQKIMHANISKRNFPLDVSEIKKLFKLKDGGEDYLFFTKDSEGKKLFYHTKKYQ